MTDFRRASEARYQQTPLKEYLSANCTTSLEQKFKNVEPRMQHQPQRQNPLLQSLIDYTHNITAPATVTPIGYNYKGDLSGAACATMGGIQFDEHAIYYVSPTKRKNSSQNFRASQQQHCRVGSPQLNSYQLAHGSRLAGVAHDFSLDETSSHLSDTAMQVLRSGSVSGSLVDTNHFGNFNNCSSSSSSSLAPPRFPNSVVTFSHATPPNSQLRQLGTLQRCNKGRSTQSLCSCDAGADTEINFDLTRPLYQYDLEGKKTHTYSCEQNAQILIRLERERKRKLSLGNEVSLLPTNAQLNSTGANVSRAKHEVQKAQLYASDLDDIPPVPPPPTLKHQNSKFGLLHKSVDAYRQSNMGRTVKVDSCDMGSLLDDCTARILKCANTIGGEFLPSAGDEHIKGRTQPDICHIGKQPDCVQYTSLGTRDDIFMPNSQKSDLSLCFLHGKTSAGLQSETHVDQLQRHKYNTIGPSSDYAKQLSQYRQQWQATANGCRCLSKSLSSFPRGHCDDNQHTENEPPYPASGTSLHSYSNLINIDGRSTTKTNRFQVPANVFNGSCSFNAATSNLLNDADASLTVLNNSNSGLIHQHEHPQHSLQYHYHQQQHQRQHQHQHQQHQHQYQSQLQRQNSRQDYLQHNHKPITLHGQLVPAQQQPQTHQVSHQQQQQQKPLHLQSNTVSIMPWKHRQCPSRCSSSSGTNSFRMYLKII